MLCNEILSLLKTLVVMVRFAVKEIELIENIFKEHLKNVTSPIV